jgi:hypothetical protein
MINMHQSSFIGANEDSYVYCILYFVIFCNCQGEGSHTLDEMRYSLQRRPICSM